MRKYVTLMLCALLLTLPAFAAAEGGDALLAYMTDGGAVPDSLRALIQPATGDAAQAEVDGVRIALDGVCYDGISIAVGWAIEDTRPEATPAIVIATDVRVNGMPVLSHVDYPTCDWAARGLFGFPNSAEGGALPGGVSGRIDGDAPTGEMRVEAKFHVLRPTMPLAVADGEDMDDAARAVFAAYGLAVAPEATDGYAVVDRQGQFLVQGEFRHMLDLYATTSLMGGHGVAAERADEPLARTGGTTLRFDATAAGATDGHVDRTPGAPIALDGMTARVTRLLATPMAVYADVFFLPDEPAGDVEALNARISLPGAWLAPANGAGEAVATSAYGVLGNETYACPEEIDGAWAMALHQVCPAPLAMPETLRLAVAGEYDEAGTSYLWALCEGL